MRQKRIIVIAVLALTIVMGVTAISVNAQQGENSTNVENETVYEYQLNNDTRIVDYTINDQTFNATFEVDGRERVTITQTSNKDGIVELERETYVLHDGRTNIEFDTGGNDAVTVDTGDTLIKVKSKSILINFERTYSAAEAIVLAAIGGVVGTVVVFVIAFRKQLKQVTEVEQFI